MSLEFSRQVQLRSTVINYVILGVWFLVYVLSHDWKRGLHGRLFLQSDEHFDALHYAGMSIYKIGILLLNLTPFLVLTVLG